MTAGRTGRRDFRQWKPRGPHMSQAYGALTYRQWRSRALAASGRMAITMTRISAVHSRATSIHWHACWLPARSAAECVDGAVLSARRSCNLPQEESADSSCSEEQHSNPSGKKLHSGFSG
ncbi:hypothetical protein MRX96_031050 [Rhipicephalus microplus]